MACQLNYLCLMRGDLLDKFPVSDPRSLPRLSGFQFNYRSTTEFLSPLAFLAVLCFIEYITNQRAEVVVKRRSGGVVLDPRLIARGGAREEGVRTFYSVRLSVGTSPFRLYTIIGNLHQAWSETGWLIGDDGEEGVPLTPFPLLYSNRWERRPTYRLHWFKPSVSPQLYKRSRIFSTHLSLHIDLTRPLYSSPLPLPEGVDGAEVEPVGIDRLFGPVLFSALRLGWIMILDNRLTNREDAPFCN